MSRQKCQQRRNEDQQPDSPERLCDRRHDSARAEPSHSQPDSEYGNQKRANAPELQHQVSNDGADQPDPVACGARACQHGGAIERWVERRVRSQREKEEERGDAQQKSDQLVEPAVVSRGKNSRDGFHGALNTIRHYRRRCRTTPEPDDYAKKRGGGQLVESIELASQHSTCRGGRPGCLWSRPPPG